MRIAIFKTAGADWRLFGLTDSSPENCATTWARKLAANPGEVRGFILTGTPLVYPKTLDEVIAAGCEELPEQGEP